MALIERLMGIESPKIPVHQFQSILAEWARGNMTGQQALDAVIFLSGSGLNAGEIAEAQTLVNSVPTGTTSLLKAERALRIQEIDQVFLLVDIQCPPYNNPATVRTRLGI